MPPYTTTRYELSDRRTTQQSPERQKNLTNFAQSFTNNNDIYVIVDENAPTAKIKNYGAVSNPEHHPYASRIDDNDPIIIIPVFDEEMVTNPFDKIEDESLYAVLQYAEVIHECGHYLYTDQPAVRKEFESLKDYFESIIQDELDDHSTTDFSEANARRILLSVFAELAQKIWNGTEDGAIEKSLCEDHDKLVKQRLQAKNELFIGQQYEGEDPSYSHNMTVADAIELRTLTTKYQTGALRRLLNEDNNKWQFRNDMHREFYYKIRPTLNTGIQRLLTEPDPISRTTKIFSTVKDIITELIEFYDIETLVSHLKNIEDHLKDHDQNDIDNQGGKAKQQANPLQNQNQKQLAKQHANKVNKSVTVVTTHQSDSNNNDTEDDPNSDQETTRDTPTQSGDNQSTKTESDENDSETNDDEVDQKSDQEQTEQDTQTSPQQDSDTDTETPTDNPDDDQTSQTANDNATQTNPEPQSCPGCGSTDTTINTKIVDKKTKAKATPPVTEDHDNIQSLRFIDINDIFCFKVTGTSLNTTSIEGQGYDVRSVESDEWEIFEPKSKYSDSPELDYLSCPDCGAETPVPLLTIHQ